MRWLVVCLLLLGACRQLLGIDDPSVTGAADGGPDGSGSGSGHDEDNDTVADLTDNCPSVPNLDQKVGDGKIGEACDPRPQTPGDKVAMFVPFFPAGSVTGLQIDSSAVFEPDEVRLSGQQITTMANFTPTRISVDLKLLTLPTSSASLSIEFGQHKCSVEACSGSGFVCLVARAVSATSETDLPFTPNGVLEMDQIAGQVLCRAGGVDAMVATSGPQTNKIKVRTSSATVQVHALTIYDQGQ